MAGVLEGVDKRTQLVGENRLELLLFRLAGSQLYGINVFKVQEVIRCPALTHIPNSNSVVREYSHCSAPELFLTACAMQTKNIHVGHGIVVCVPQFNHPIRVAERAAVLDILSHGRLEIAEFTG